MFKSQANIIASTTILKGIGMLLFCLYSSQLLAQKSCNKHLGLTILDKESNTILAFASIKIPQLNLQGTTDEHGHLNVENACPGKISIEVYHISCQADTFYINIKNDTDTSIYLEHKAVELKSVDVSHAQSQDRFTVHSETLSNDELNDNFGDGLKGISNKVAALNFTSGGVGTQKPSINGLGGSRVALVYNGTALKYQQWGNEHASSVSLFSGDEVEVIDELGTLKYGSDAFSGAVIIKDASIFDAKNPVNLSLQNRLQSNALGASINFKSSGHLHKVGELYYRAGAEINRYSNANTPTGYISNTGNSGNNYFFHLGKKWGSYNAEIIYLHSNSKQGIYTGSHIGNTTDLVRLLENQDNRADSNTAFKINRPFIQETHEISQIKVKRAIKNGSLNFDVSRQINLRREFDLNGPRGNREQPNIQLGLSNYTAGLNAEWFNGNNLFLIGTNVQREENVFNFSRIIPSYVAFNAGLYAGFKHYFNTFYINIGARAESQSYNADISFDRFANIDTVTFAEQGISTFASVHFGNKKVAQQILVGKGFRFPNAFELYAFGIHHGSAEFVMGNTNLGVEKAYNLSYRLIYNTQKFHLEVNPYFRYFKDFIVSAPTGETVLTISGAFPSYNTNNQDVITPGININADYKFNKKNKIQLVASRVFNQDVNTKQSVYGINPGSANLTYSYTLSNDVQLNAEANYLYGTGGGQAYLLENKSIENSEAALIYNASINYNLNTNLRLRFGAQNILNSTYYRYTNNSRIFYPEVGRNFFLSIKYNNHKKQTNEKTTPKI